MTLIFQKYKLLIIALLSLMVVASVTWALTTKTKANKIPSRGVFVLENIVSDAYNG